MSDFRVTIPELPSFVAKMQTAPRVIDEEMGKAGKRAGQLVRDQATRHVPVKTGRLKASIYNTVTTGGMVTTAKVGTNVHYAKYVEFGRGPITAAPGRMLRFEIGGRVLFRHSVGPAKARPFLHRAFNEMKGRIRAEFHAVAARVIARLS